MTPSPALSKTEIAQWTRASRRARQVRFLQQNGVPHDVDLDGWPVVRRCDFERRPEMAQDRLAWKPHKVA